SGNFTKLALVSALISIPIGIYVNNTWLSQFAYRANIPWWVYGLVVVVVLLITILAIIGQIFKTSRMSPAEVIRQE
ncbi:MAG: hypothetical protein OEX02_11670, partial [Cyclobacteriaceae bacterium]|nr:hypothetical protein [Cyclobacteriaceae bacterium]